MAGRSTARTGRLAVVAVLAAMAAALRPAATAAAATTGTSRGTVTGPGDAAAPFVLVNAFGDTDIYGAVTDNFGRYTIPSVQPGSYDLLFIPPEDSGLASFSYPGSVVVTAGGTKVVDVELEPFGEVSGTITGPGGVPLPTVDVGLESEDGFFADTTDINGDYSLSGMAPGTYTLSVLPPSQYGLAPTFVTPVEVVGGENLDLDVELLAGGTIAG